MSVVSLIDRAPSGVAARLGAGTRSARLLAPVVNRLLPHTETLVTVRSGAAAGLRILIQPRREKFYWTGAYEAATQRALVTMLSRGMTFWDVGAHAGFMTLLASRLVGEFGLVHAFEPADPNRRRLYATVAANHVSNVVVHGVAASATSGTVTLHRHGSTSMWTTIPELGDEPASVVPSRTLDDLADELGIPDVIKVDVEGAEANVLRGAEMLLASGLPTLLVEFSSKEQLLQARALCTEHTFTALDDTHWLLEGRAT